MLVILMVVSLILFASGCSQKAPENETKKVDNETKKAENETGNITKEAEGVPQEVGNVVEKSDQNVMQTLANKNFLILVQLINTAGLEKTLAEEGIYTVFAPTDKAFSELPEGTVSSLTNNTSELKKVLTYHVVAGKILMKQDLENMTSIKTLEGEELTINVTANGIQVGGANVTQADIEASNGVIHQIDKVLIPQK